jgi:hypothetical protein
MMFKIGQSLEADRQDVKVGIINICLVPYCFLKEIMLNVVFIYKSSQLCLHSLYHLARLKLTSSSSDGIYVE